MTYNLRRSTKDQLIDGLRLGVDSRDWPRWAASRKSLHVRICKLRRSGVIITATDIPGTGNGKPAVVYRLQGIDQ